MEWLIAIWNKVNKPLHYLLVGAVLVRVAPPTLSWAGYIFLAVGAAGVLEWVINKLKQYLKHRRYLKKIEKYIPYMTENEREIIAYLLKRNEKTFTCADDGGYANTLIGRGIVVPAMRPGQRFNLEDMPVTIPDEIWDLFVKHKDQFPHKPTEDKTHPWRIPWECR